MADPKASIEITAHSKSLGSKLREARSKFSAFAGDLRRSLFGGRKKTDIDSDDTAKDIAKKQKKDAEFARAAAAQAVGNLASSAVSSFGGFLADQGRDVMEFNDSLTRLRITAGKTPEEMSAFADSVRRTSSQVGIGAKDILDGASAYVALTGDMDGAAAMSSTFARVAQATNSTVGDIAQTAAALKQQMNINPADMERTFSALAVQGKAGAIELKDLAAQMSSIAPQWAQFGDGKGVKGVQQLGAALQIVKRGFGGDAGETVTGLQAFLTSVVKHAPQLKKAGFDVYTKNAVTGKKELKNVLDIVDGIANSKLAKDPTALVKGLGRVEAYRAFIQLRDNRDELNKLVVASEDAGAIQKDLDSYTQSAGGRMKIAWQGAKNEIAEAFTPERIDIFVKAVEGAAAGIAKIVGGMSDAMTKLDHLSRGAAELIFGKSEEDKARDASNKTHDDRVNQAAGALLTSNPGLMSDPEALNAAARKQVAEEENMARTIASGGRVGGPRTSSFTTYAPAFGDRTKKGGPREFLGLKGYTKTSTQNDYSVSELQALRSQVNGEKGGSSIGKALVTQAIDKQISDKVAAAINAQTKQLVDAMNGVTTKVQVGSETVVKAGKNSEVHARKPAT